MEANIATDVAEGASGSSETSVVTESESTGDDVPIFVDDEDEEPKTQGDKPA